MRSKIKSRIQLKHILSNLRKKGRKIVFTNGCFELIHAGHIKCLKKAKGFGDILVLAVNSDSSVRRIKGKKRPIVPSKERMEIAASLEYVDYVVLFNESTPAKIIEELRPDVLVKGADYKKKKIVGRSTVEKYGGKVRTVPLAKNKSTSGLIKKICRIYTG